MERDRSNSIDYSAYTIDELFDVKQNINSETYPERYQQVLDEIRKKENFESFDSDLSELETHHSYEDDPISQLTDWSPLKSGGANFKTHKLVEIDHWRIEFQPTIFSMLFAGLFFVVSIYTFWEFTLPFISPFQFPNTIEKALPLLVPIIFFITSLFMLYQLSVKRVFDKDARVYWKGRTKPKNLLNFDAHDKSTPFSNIHALQLLTELCSGGKGSNYYSYELNLILKDGKRVNVVDHGNQESIRADANQLALFLRVPVWEFHDENEVSFLSRLFK